MTAYVKNDLLLNIMRLNCNSIIEKPFTLNKLNGEIQKCLGIL